MRGILWLHDNFDLETAPLTFWISAASIHTEGSDIECNILMHDYFRSASGAHSQTPTNSLRDSVEERIVHQGECTFQAIKRYGENMLSG
jgi:hypothetical protein